MANSTVLFAFNLFFLASFYSAVLGGMGPLVPALADAIAVELIVSGLSIGSFSADNVWVDSDFDSIFSLNMRSCIDIVFILFKVSQQALIPIVDPF
ncbi:hypothetical protein Tco_1202759 [Tanacetum coccineum]